MSFLKRMKTSRQDLGLIDMIFVLTKSAAAANYGMRIGTCSIWACPAVRYLAKLCQTILNNNVKTDTIHESLMPCPFTGPKMFCAGPKFLSQPKNFTAFSASSKTFMPAQKPILLNANHLFVWHKMFVTGITLDWHNM